MRIRLAALLCLLLAVTFTLAGCGGSGGSSGGGTASFLFTQTAPDFNSAIVNSYPAASTGSAVAATSSAALPTDTIGYGVHGDGAGKIYSLGNSTDGTVNGNLTGTLVVNVYSTTNGVLTLTRSFNYTPADGALAFSLAADPTGIVYISLTDSTFLKFAANASGAATPTIFNTGVILFPMATDSAGNLYGYAGSGVIGVFPAGFTNPIPPKVLFFSSAVIVSDMVVDSNQNIYLTGYDSTATPFISEFSSAVNTTSPMKTISGTSTLMVNPVALALDGSGNIYEEDAPTTAITSHSNTIYTFSPSASNNQAPTSHFTMAATTLAPATFVGLVAY